MIHMLHKKLNVAKISPRISLDVTSMCIPLDQLRQAYKEAKVQLQLARQSIVKKDKRIF